MSLLSIAALQIAWMARWIPAQRCRMSVESKRGKVTDVGRERGIPSRVAAFLGLTAGCRHAKADERLFGAEQRGADPLVSLP